MLFKIIYSTTTTEESSLEINQRYIVRWSSYMAIVKILRQDFVDKALL